MADVTIHIQMDNKSNIQVSGKVDDLLLAPFTTQLSMLLSTAVSVSA